MSLPRRAPDFDDLTAEAGAVSGDLHLFLAWLVDEGHVPHPYAAVAALQHLPRYRHLFPKFLDAWDDLRARSARQCLTVVA